jgi:hypothetical protein
MNGSLNYILFTQPLHATSPYTVAPDIHVVRVVSLPTLYLFFIQLNRKFFICFLLSPFIDTLSSSGNKNFPCKKKPAYSS